MEARENIVQWGAMGRPIGLQGSVCIYEDVTGDKTGAIERDHIVNDVFSISK